MITKWKIFNFKSVRQETVLDFAPLTLFAGPNSSGKSTVLQSILLISQTLSHKVGSRSVVLNGAFAKLGQFDDLRSVDGDANQILVGWECKTRDQQRDRSITERTLATTQPILLRRRASLESVQCEVSFDTDPASPQRELFQLQPRLFSISVSGTSRGENYEDIRSSISISQAVGTGPDISEKLSRFRDVPKNEAVRAGLGYDPRIDDGSMFELTEEWASAEVIGCTFRHFLPSRLLLEIDPAEEMAQVIAFTLIGEPPRLLGFRRRQLLEGKVLLPTSVIEKLRDLLLPNRDDGDEVAPSLRDVFYAPQPEGVTFAEWYNRFRRLPRVQRENIQKTLEDSDQLMDRVIETIKDEMQSSPQLISWPLPPALTEAVNYLDRFFSTSVKYLGPLRDEPKPLYPLAASADPADVGLRGEFTAAVLDLHKDLTIRYVPTANFGSAAAKQDSVFRSLSAAVTDWVQYLGIAEEVDTRDRGKLGHELKVSVAKGGKAHDLTHVGVGVSQVLPILVMSLLADEDTTLIFEQPELHLHPKVQTLLGDFFLSMTFLGKQCIVETHSEYLINRLRFRAASAPAERSLVDLVKIYFLEKKEGVSAFKEVNINEYGAILDWPEGFFDQSQQEAEEILKAASAKRKEKTPRKDDAERKH